MSVLDNKKLFVGVGATLLTISGACVGFIVGRNDAEMEMAEEIKDALDREYVRIRDHFESMYKRDTPADYSDIPDGVVLDDRHQYIRIDKEALATEEGRKNVLNQLREALASAAAGDAPTDEPIEVGAVEEELGPVNPPERIFEQEERADVDYQHLIESRGPEAPFVLSREEWLRNDAKYEEYKLTFFEGDGVLLDDEDQIIPDTDMVVGDKNLQMFGVMSEDNNVVYIQNDRTESIYQVTRDFGTASAALYGEQADEDRIIEHSSMKRRKPRKDD